jgi:hypothetical protein
MPGSKSRTSPPQRFSLAFMIRAKTVRLSRGRCRFDWPDDMPINASRNAGRTIVTSKVASCTTIRAITALKNSRCSDGDLACQTLANCFPAVINDLLAAACSNSTPIDWSSCS